MVIRYFRFTNLRNSKYERTCRSQPYEITSVYVFTFNSAYMYIVHCTYNIIQCIILSTLNVPK